MTVRNPISDSSSAGEHVETINECRTPHDVVPTPDELDCVLQAERDVLIAHIGILKAANENLVIATLDAQTLRANAEAANQRQDEFLAMLAHELRNPLAPIAMASALLARMPDQTTQILNIQQIIQRQVGHLSRLLDELLDAARINSGKVVLTRTPVVIAELILCAVETIQSRIAERQQLLELDLPSTDLVTIGDAVRLVQVFSNLLSNASKFTQDGGKIAISTSVSGSDVVIKVADNGSGIPPELISHIFSLFTQGPRSLARSEGGLGIGLSVVRNIVELHGGRIEASSAGEGQGSVFTLTLPVSISPQSPVPALPALITSTHDLQILVVEDNVDANNTLSAFLQLEGFTVTSAYDGIGGLSVASSRHFDVLICDIGLPGIDGYNLIQKLRAVLGNNMPLTIALSGYGQIEDRTRALAAGFDKYLIKPAEIPQLLNLIAGFAGKQAEHGG